MADWIPLYLADFAGRTNHLTLEEEGALLHVLRLLWTQPDRSIPDDAEWIRTQMGITGSNFDRAVAPIIDEFCGRADGRITCPMLEGWIQLHRRTTPRQWIPLEIQRAVWQRDGSKCVYCGSTEGPFHLDHRVPYARGGEGSIENLVVACAPCNWAKGSMTVEEWKGAQ